MEKIAEYLRNTISDGMAIKDIVDIFENSCQPMNEEDMILFETGTYSFTGKPMFNFSLVRQFPNDEEEYYQIHVDVLYMPTEENKDFERTIWNEDIEENIFNYIKKTPEFSFCKDKEFSKLEIYLDET